jgi:CubicO group peptidase (beta-lactamase class C family)
LRLGCSGNSLIRDFRSCILFSLLAVLFACGNEQASDCAHAQEYPIPDRAILDSIADQHIAEGNFPFIYVRIEDGEGCLRYDYYTSNADLMGDKVVDEKTPIRIWSMSKAVTAAMTMDLIEDGLLSLDDDVSQFIPEFENLKVAVFDTVDAACPYEVEDLKTTMTIRHLLNHEAGFYYGETQYPCIDEPFRDLGLAENQSTDSLIAALSRLPLLYQPGESEYYGFATSVLGFVLERVSGKKLDELIQERFSEPLDLSLFTYHKGEKELLPFFKGVDSTISKGSANDADLMGQTPPYQKGGANLGGEGMIANAESYIGFLRMLMHEGKGILEPASIDTLVSPQTQKDSRWGHMGFTIWITGDTMRHLGRGVENLWVGGGYEYTQYWIDKERDLVAVLMTQMRDSRRGHEYWDELKGALYAPWIAAESKENKEE